MWLCYGKVYNSVFQCSMFGHDFVKYQIGSCNTRCMRLFATLMSPYMQECVFGDKGTIMPSQSLLNILRTADWPELYPRVTFATTQST